MNILLLCDEYPPGPHGGIGIAVRMLARALHRQGHHVVVAGFYPWGYGGRDFMVDDGVPVYRFRRGLDVGALGREATSFASRAALATLRRSGVLERDIEASLRRYGEFLRRIIVEHDIDIVEQPDYQDYMRFCAHYVWFPVLPVVTVIKLHSSMTFLRRETGRPIPRVVEQMEEDLLRRADRAASVSEYTARRTKAITGYPGPVKVLYNGVEIPETRAAEKREMSVLFAGALRRQKGLGQLLRAWNAVHRALPQARLDLYGRGRPGEFIRALEPDARNGVRFWGAVDHSTLQRRFAQASVAVFPSYVESFSLAPLEAMAHETAVIYTERASGPEVIADGETGLLVNPDDTEGLAVRIIRLLTDRPLRERLAQAGANSVRERFDIEHVAAQHARWYADVLSWYAGPDSGRSES